MSARHDGSGGERWFFSWRSWEPNVCMHPPEQFLSLLLPFSRASKWQFSCHLTEDNLLLRMLNDRNNAGIIILFWLWHEVNFNFSLTQIIFHQLSILVVEKQTLGYCKHLKDYSEKCEDFGIINNDLMITKWSSWILASDVCAVSHFLVPVLVSPPFFSAVALTLTQKDTLVSTVVRNVTGKSL